jgi:hypothetical protein
MDQFWSPYSYVGANPLMHVDPWGLMASTDPINAAGTGCYETGPQMDLGSSRITAIAPVKSFSPDLTPTPIMPRTYNSKAAVAAFMNQMESSKDVNTPRYEAPAVGVIPQGRKISQEDPDFAVLSVGASLPFAKIIGFSASVIRDKYGNYYFAGPTSGLGYSWNPFPADASFVTGYFKTEPKNEESLKSALQGPGLSMQMGFGFGAGKMISSNGQPAYYYGIMTPQGGVSTGFTYRNLGKIGGSK